LREAQFAASQQTHPRGKAIRMSVESGAARYQTLLLARACVLASGLWW